MTAKIRIPARLEQLLKGSPYKSKLDILIERVSTIVGNGVLPFFPSYTNHKTEHIEDVLTSIEELIPEEVWDGKRRSTRQSLLSGADAAVIVGATLLHDFAMFLQIEGFRELIAPNSHFRPLRWFDQKHQDHAGDRPWSELWADYEAEARRFDSRQKTNILGEEAAGDWKYTSLPAADGNWTKNHCHIVGEFLRRHHARLAHEIAINGFPGLEAGDGDDEFPVLATRGNEISKLANLIGLTARSHGTSLRLCQRYLDDELDLRKNARPHDCAVLYAMALLRVADYLQLDKRRAPPVLLQLVDPQSPVSVREWQAHEAVERVASANDRTAIMVTVREHTDSDNAIPLSMYLHLESLLTGVQRELDHSNAVLSESYGRLEDLGLDQLKLAKTRVESNLLEPRFRDRLPYLPRRTGFSVDSQILPLLVGPLYGDNPNVGVRELMQNAVDAVRELDSWCKARKVDPASLDLQPIAHGYDISFEFIEQQQGKWMLHVTDRGIGMRGETLADYFLRAGASFRNSSDWKKEFIDNDGRTKITRTGQFGLGVFAIFLLGPSFELWTRHAAEGKDGGYYLKATEASSLIEIQKKPDLKTGTILKVEIGVTDAQRRFCELLSTEKSGDLSRRLGWYCWDWPRICISITRADQGPLQLSNSPVWPVADSNPDPAVSIVDTEVLRKSLEEYASLTESLTSSAGEIPPPKRVLWSYDSPFGIGHVSVNGFSVSGDSTVARVSGLRVGLAFDTSPLARPHLSFDDPDSTIVMQITRADFQRPQPAVSHAIRSDIILNLIAHALICGPKERHECGWFADYHQGLTSGVSRRRKLPHKGLDWRWVSDRHGFVPLDARLLGFLSADAIKVVGVVSSAFSDDMPLLTAFKDSDELGTLGVINGLIFDNPSFSRDGLSFAHDQLRPRFRPQSPLITHHQIEVHEWMRACHSLRNSFNNNLGYDLRRLAVSFSHEAWNLAVNGGRFAYGEQRGRRVHCFPNYAGPEAPEPLLEFLDNQFWERRDRFPREYFTYDNTLWFVAELQRPDHGTLHSQISRAWEETLGQTAIPFEAAARKAMVEKASENPALGRHIDSWRRIVESDRRRRGD